MDRRYRRPLARAFSAQALSNSAAQAAPRTALPQLLVALSAEKRSSLESSNFGLLGSLRDKKKK